MAWVAQDDLQSYSLGDLNTLNGGSGFSGAWSGDTDFDVVDEDTFFGNRAVKAVNANGACTRTLTTSVSSGTLWFAMRGGGGGDAQVDLKLSGGSNAIRVSMRDAGNNIKVLGNVTTTIVSGYDTNTWYLFEVLLNGDDTIDIRYYKEGEGWSDWTTGLAYNGSGNITDFSFNHGSSQTVMHSGVYASNPITFNDSYIRTHTTLLDDLISYWDFEESSGTRYDLWGSNNLTDNNTVGQGTGKIGNCADLEAGSSEHLSITDASQSGLDITGDFTFSFWVNLETNVATASPVIVDKWLGSGNQRSYLLKFLDNSGTDALYACLSPDGTSGAGTCSYIDFSSDLSTSTWYHIVITYDASAGQVKLYRNGTLQNTGSSYPSSIYNSTGDVWFFSENGSGGHFDGLVDEFGIWSRVLTTDEISDLYNSGDAIAFHNPTAVEGNITLTRQLVSYWELEESSGTRDDSHGSNDLTDGNTVTQGTGKKGNCADFEQSNSEYLAITDASQTGLAITGDISFTGWVNVESESADNTIFSKYKYTGSDRGYWLRHETTASELRFTISNNGSTTENYAVTWNPTASTWYHIVVAWDASASTAYFYVDGVLLGTDTGSMTSIYDNGGDFRLGSEGADTNYWDGLLDECAIYNRVLDVADVRALYGYDSPPQYSAQTDVTVNASVQTATFTIPSYDVSAPKTVSPSVLTATFTIPSYTIDAGGNVTVPVSVQTATFTIPSYTPQTEATVSPSVQVATFSIPTYTVSVISNISVSPSVFVATFSLGTPSEIGGFWSDKYGSDSFAWVDKY